MFEHFYVTCDTGIVHFDARGRRSYDLHGLKARKVGEGEYKFRLEGDAARAIVSAQIEIAEPWSKETVKAVGLAPADPASDDVVSDGEEVRKLQYGLIDAAKYLVLLSLKGSSCLVKVMRHLPLPYHVNSKSPTSLRVWSNPRFKSCDGVGFMLFITSRSVS